MHGDDLVIVEAKGFGMGGRANLAVTKNGQQLSQAWIRKKQRELIDLVRGDPANAATWQKWADKLKNKIRDGKIKALVVGTEVDDAAGVIGSVTYEMRNWSDLGATTFVN